jgi:hypothetical protein
MMQSHIRETVYDKTYAHFFHMWELATGPSKFQTQENFPNLFYFCHPVYHFLADISNKSVCLTKDEGIIKLKLQPKIFLLQLSLLYVGNLLLLYSRR